MAAGGIAMENQKCISVNFRDGTLEVPIYVASQINMITDYFDDDIPEGASIDIIDVSSEVGLISIDFIKRFNNLDYTPICPLFGNYLKENRYPEEIVEFIYSYSLRQLVDIILGSHFMNIPKLYSLSLAALASFYRTLAHKNPHVNNLIFPDIEISEEQEKEIIAKYYTKEIVMGNICDLIEPGVPFRVPKSYEEPPVPPPQDPASGGGSGGGPAASGGGSGGGPAASGGGSGGGPAASGGGSGGGLTASGHGSDDFNFNTRNLYYRLSTFDFANIEPSDQRYIKSIIENDINHIIFDDFIKFM